MPVRSNVMPDRLAFVKDHVKFGVWGFDRFNVFLDGSLIECDRAIAGDKKHGQVWYTDSDNAEKTKRGKVVFLPRALDTYELHDDYWPQLKDKIAITLDGVNVAGKCSAASEIGGFVVVVKHDDDGNVVVKGDDFVTERLTGVVEIRPK